MKHNKKLLVRIQIVLFVFLTILPNMQSKAVLSNVSWDETFDSDLSDWDLQCYKSPLAVLKPTTNRFSIIDGKLTSPSSPNFEPLNRALHDSNIAYGKWSFQWMVSKSENTYDAVEFIFTDYNTHPYNATGRGYPDTEFYAGYALSLVSYAKDGGPGIWLVRFNNYTNSIPTVLQSYKFNSTLHGSHDIEITRNITGNFNVKFDSELLLNITDNNWKTSEKFNFVSFQGNSSIDNIHVDNLGLTIPTSPESNDKNNLPLSNEAFIFGIFVISLVVFLKRKRSIR